MATLVSSCHIKGGCGKSATLLSLAAYASTKGQRVLFVDLDAQGTSFNYLTRRQVKVVGPKNRREYLEQFLEGPYPCDIKSGADLTKVSVFHYPGEMFSQDAHFRPEFRDAFKSKLTEMLSDDTLVLFDFSQARRDESFIDPFGILQQPSLRCRLLVPSRPVQKEIEDGRQNAKVLVEMLKESGVRDVHSIEVLNMCRPENVYWQEQRELVSKYLAPDKKEIMERVFQFKAPQKDDLKRLVVSRFFGAELDERSYERIFEIPDIDGQFKFPFVIRQSEDIQKGYSPILDSGVDWKVYMGSSELLNRLKWMIEGIKYKTPDKIETEEDFDMEIKRVNALYGPRFMILVPPQDRERTREGIARNSLTINPWKQLFYKLMDDRFSERSQLGYSSDRPRFYHLLEIQRAHFMVLPGTIANTSPFGKMIVDTSLAHYFNTLHQLYEEIK
jgi:hypothetical protein